MKKIQIAALLSACLSPLRAADAPARLNSIDVSSDSVTVILNAPVKHKTAVYPDPTRLIVDLLGATLDASKKLKGEGLHLLGVRAGARKQGDMDVARVVLDLSSPVEYALAWDGPRLRISLGKAKAPAPAAMAPQPTLKISPAAAPITAVPAAVSVKKTAAPKLKPVEQALELRLSATDAAGLPAKGAHQARFSLVDLDDQEVWVETTTITSLNGASRAWLGREKELPEDLDPACRLEIMPLDQGLTVRTTPVYLKIGSFSDQANATRLQEELMGAFSQILIVTTDIHGKTMFQVRVGPVESGISAEIIRRKLRTLGYQPALSEQ